MPLDFRMKHEGAPPARFLAKLRMKFKAEGFSPILADVFAPVMTEAEAENLGDDLKQELTAIIQVLKRYGVPADKAEQVIREEVQKLIEQGTQTELSEDEPLYGVEAQSRNLIQMIADRVRPVREPTYPRPPRPSEPRLGNRHTMTAALSDALLARIDRRHTPTIGQRFVGMSLSDMAYASVQASGHRPMNTAEAVRMATHTTSDFPLVLGGTLGNLLARNMPQIAPALLKAAHEVKAGDYRSGHLLGLSASGVPGEIGEGGEIRHVTIDEFGELKPVPRDFGAMFRLSNKAIQNDDLGLFDEIGKHLMKGANERLRRVLLEPLLANSGAGHAMADGKTVFHADHGNLASVGAELSVTSLSSARLALRTQKGKQGELLAVDPWALVVPPHLETAAQMVLTEINATSTADVNPFSGALELIVEPGLTDPKAWYLIGNPAAVDGLAYAYLDGQSAPAVEAKPGWDTLGMEFRLVWALDAKFVSSASWYKNPGQ